MKYPFKPLILILSLSTSLLLVSGNFSSWAVTLRDGMTYFKKPPRLLSVTSSRDGSFIWGANYYFTIRVHEKSDEPVHMIVITQRSGADIPQFLAKDTRVFEGTRDRAGTALKLKDVSLKSSPMKLTVVFDTPVPAGKTFTIQLFPVRNPLTGGSYTYSVTAFPPGARPFGQYIGVGQIRIIDRNRN